MPDYVRGAIFRLDFATVLQGELRDGEPLGERFVVVVSPRSLNRNLHTVVVAPTSASEPDKKSESLTNVLLERDETATGITAEKCVVQLHLLYSLNHERLGQQVGEVTSQDVLDEIEFSGVCVVGDPL